MRDASGYHYIVWVKYVLYYTTRKASISSKEPVIRQEYKTRTRPTAAIGYFSGEFE